MCTVHSFCNIGILKVIFITLKVVIFTLINTFKDTIRYYFKEAKNTFFIYFLFLHFIYMYINH